MNNRNFSSDNITQENRDGMKSLLLEQMPLHIGDSVELQISDKRYSATLIGYLEGQSFIVTLPEEDAKCIQPEDGQTIIVRFYSNKRHYAFETHTKFVSCEPFPHMHLVYPKAIQALIDRQYDRVRVNISGTADIPGGQSITCEIHDISIGGALIALNCKAGEVSGPLSLTLRVVINGIEYSLSLDSEIRSVRISDSANDDAPVVLQGLAFNDLSEQEILALAAFELVPDWQVAV